MRVYQLIGRTTAPVRSIERVPRPQIAIEEVQQNFSNNAQQG
jgi:hypothetical protein